LFCLQQSESTVPLHEGRRESVGGGHKEAPAGGGSAGRGQGCPQVLDDRTQCPVQEPHAVIRHQ